MPSTQAHKFKGVLFHGTHRKHLESVSEVGLVPGIGPMVEWAYGDYLGEEYNHPVTGEPLVPELLYFTGPNSPEAGTQDESSIAKAFSYVRHAISYEKYDGDYSKVTWEDIKNHGLLVAVGKDDLPGGLYFRGEDEQFFEVGLDWDTEEVEHTDLGPSFVSEYSTGPEPGDYFTVHDVAATRVIYGDELVRLGKALESQWPEAMLYGQMILPLEFRNLILRHYGPGPHPGTGTSQDVHGGGAGIQAPEGRYSRFAIRHDKWSEKTKSKVMDFIESEYEPIPASNLKDIYFNSWLLPDGRLISVTEHDYLGRQIYQKFGPEEFGERKFVKLEMHELFQQGFVRVNFIDWGAASKKPTLHMDIDKYIELPEAVETAISDMYWAAFDYETDTEPVIYLQWFDREGEIQGVTTSPQWNTFKPLREISRELGFKIDKSMAVNRHYGPGHHPGTGTSQDVHGKGGGWWQDNPQAEGRDWTPGKNSMTAGFKDATVDPRDIAKLPGARGEEKNIDQERVKELAKSIKEEGLKWKPLIIVEMDGTAHIWEGNHRIRAAIEAGLDSIAVEIRYFGGAEERSGVWKPELVERGGPGSGHHGHAGRPGEVGGSAPSGAIPNRSYLIRLAHKYDDFDKFSRDYSLDNVTGLAFHLTHEKDFFIDSEKGPRDMSSLGMGKMTAGAFMVTTDIENWAATIGERPYVAIIDLSDLEYGVDYGNATRGFGQEFYISNPTKANVVNILPLSDAIKFSRHFYEYVLPQSKEELRDIWEWARTQPVERGGPGSGHHGHAGRPGKVGGSLPGAGTGLGEFDFEGSQPGAGGKGYRKIPFDNTYDTAPTGLRRLAKKEQEETGEFRWAYWDNSNPDDVHTKMFEDKEAAMEFIANEMRKLDYEIHYAFSDATMIFEHTQKDAHRITFDHQDVLAMMELSKYPQNTNIIDIHNHPPQKSGVDIPPSFSDFDFSMGPLQTNEWWVVTPHGKYVVKKGEQGTPHFASSDVYQLEKEWNYWVDNNQDRWFPRQEHLVNLKAANNPEDGKKFVEMRLELIRKTVEDMGYFEMEWMPNE